ncbi:MAG: apolipoprotein N-acyltransferase [Dongiaceae bacterium]
MIPWQPRLKALASLFLARPRISAFLLGAAATLGLPPLYIFPAFLAAVPLLLWLLNEAPTSRQRFIRGWWFGFGYFLCSLYWISIAFTIEPETYGWLIPFSLIGLPALLAFYPAAAAYFAFRWPMPPLQRLIMFSLFWVLAELLQGVLFTGFPWNALGYMLGFADGLAQGAALAGLYGLSLLAILLAASLAVFLPPFRYSKAWRFPMIMLMAAGALQIWGTARLPAAKPAAEGAPLIRLVQPHIAQRMKWHPDEWPQHLQKLLILSQIQNLPGKNPDLIIWPETAVPFALMENKEVRQSIANAVPPGAFLVTGTLRLIRDETGKVESLRNSLVALDHQGAAVAVYDKFHLVPWGEYVPGRKLFGGLPFLAGSIDFSPGPGPAAMQLDNLPPFSPLICYEVIFPGKVTPIQKVRWLLNITNDAWYGHTAGPYQHLASSRFRSIETGLPLIRVANTGISAVIDAHGRVRESMALGMTGFIDAALPPALKPPLYARFGNTILATIMLLLALSAKWSGRDKKKAA